VLAAPHRLRHSAEFTSVLRGRRSRRAGSRLLVVHATLRTAELSQDSAAPLPARVGFVVSKAVGNAVVRNRTKRILRHQMAARLQTLPAGTDVVVRANPGAAGRSSSVLGAELDRLLPRVVRTADEPGAR